MLPSLNFLSDNSDYKLNVQKILSYMNSINYLIVNQ